MLWTLNRLTLLFEASSNGFRWEPTAIIFPRQNDLKRAFIISLPIIWREGWRVGLEYAVTLLINAVVSVEMSFLKAISSYILESVSLVGLASIPSHCRCSSAD